MKRILLLAALTLAGVCGAQGAAADPAPAAEVEPSVDPAPAPAAEVASTDAAPPASEARPPAVEIALKAGAHFPQVLSKLKTSLDASLTVGIAPFKGRQLQFFAGLGYSQPTHQIVLDDPRLGAAGGSYTSTLVIQDLSTTLGAKYFLLPPDRFVVPYLGTGFRVHFMRGEVEGNGGADFGKYTETDTRYGFVLFGGVGLHLGPGLLLAELAFDYAPIGQRMTGEANLGALSLVVGYGLLLF